MDDKDNEKEEGSLEKNESSLVKKPNKLEQIEQLEQIIDGIPEDERKDRVTYLLHELKTEIIERTPQDNPEIIKILAETTDNDNERRFKYLTQKQTDKTELEKAELEFRKIKHKDTFSLIRPIVYAILALIIVCIGIGIWLCATGRETLGASLITGSITSVLSFAAGLGVSEKFKDKKPKEDEE